MKASHASRHRAGQRVTKKTSSKAKLSNDTENQSAGISGREVHGGRHGESMHPSTKREKEPRMVASDAKLLRLISDHIKHKPAASEYWQNANKERKKKQWRAEGPPTSPPKTYNSKAPQKNPRRSFRFRAGSLATRK